VDICVIRIYKRWQIFKMTTETYIVNLTKPWQLLTLTISSIGLLFMTHFALKTFDLGLIGFFLSLLISVTFFFILKKRLIYKTELGLNKNQVSIGDKSFDLKDIVKYKTHRMKGAGLVLKLTNDRTYRLSSNDNFCDSHEFVKFLNDFENMVSDKSEIQKGMSFGETKFGFYFAICSTLFLITAIIFQTVTGKYLEFSGIAMMLVALTTLWSGIEIKKTFANRVDGSASEY
jgi:hypothetical protein